MALRLCLIAVTGALAAAVAHVAIDVAGDYVLARDAYDGIAHHSRALLLAAVGVAILIAAIRTIFDILDRRCDSKPSVLAAVRDALGDPARFAAATAGVAIVALVAMESFDCLLTGRIDGVTDLFGGSVLLGTGAAGLSGTLFGLLAHRVARAIADRELPISAFIVAAFSRLSLRPAPLPLAQNRARATRSVGRALLLSRRACKRGPPVPISG
ncbi:MAG: hypothetical protein ABI231_05765 [Candidatus Tumulicola sp.]